MILRLQGYLVDTAGTGKEAIEKSNLNSYDLALVDFRLPDIDGTELLTAMREPTSGMVKVMLTGYPTDENRAEALEQHAEAYLVKPVKIEELLHTVKESLRRQAERATNTDTEAPTQSRKEFVVVAIGASAGGPMALERVLSKIPNHLQAAFVISQHMPNGFTKPFADRLSTLTNLHVKEAEVGDLLHAGEALITPGGFNMEVTTGGRIHLTRTDETPAPSIDVMMRTAAEAYGSRTIGVLLTGMLKDGVNGMKAIKEKGGVTIVQDENSSVVYGMPKAALDAGVADVVADIFQIPNLIVNALAKTIPSDQSN